MIASTATIELADHALFIRARTVGAPQHVHARSGVLNQSQSEDGEPQWLHFKISEIEQNADTGFVVILRLTLCLCVRFRDGFGVIAMAL